MRTYESDEHFDRRGRPISEGCSVRGGDEVGRVIELRPTDPPHYAEVDVRFPSGVETFSCTARWPDDYRAWELEVVR